MTLSAIGTTCVVGRCPLVIVHRHVAIARLADERRGSSTTTGARLEPIPGQLVVVSDLLGTFLGRVAHEERREAGALPQHPSDLIWAGNVAELQRHGAHDVLE